MKYLWVMLFIASVASLEFLHEFRGKEGAGAAVCLAPDSQHQAVRDVLIQHLQTHR